MKNFLHTIGYISFAFIAFLAFKQVQASGLFDTYALNRYLKRNTVEDPYGKELHNFSQKTN